MLYKISLTDSERELLADLVGHRLDFVRSDGWSALLRSGDIGLHAVPEEVATPDTEHPGGDVERPLVKIAEDPDVIGSDRTVAEDLGLVISVNVISILVSFSPVKDFPPEEILPGVLLPASKGYGWIYYPPGLLVQAQLEAGADSALIQLDRAFELVTESYPSVVFYTRGYFLRVSIDGLPEQEDWVRFDSYVRQPIQRDLPA